MVRPCEFKGPCLQASTAGSRQPLPGGGGLAAAAAHVPSFFYFYFYFFCVEIKFLAPNTYTVFPSGQGGTTGHFFFIASVDVGARPRVRVPSSSYISSRLW